VRIKVWFGRATLGYRLRRTLPAAAAELLELLEAAGHQAFLVGGCVRDLLLGDQPKDWDLTTSATTDQILAILPQGRLMGAGRFGGTVMVVRETKPYEITPFRGEGLMGDLGRRDFTVNAMALERNGRFHDPLHGCLDLQAGLLRACGGAIERLTEDPLRALRAVRLAAQLNLRLDRELATALPVAARMLGGVPPERIGLEFGRMMTTLRPAWAVERLREFGLLATVAPELLEMVGVEQNEFHAHPVWEHSLLALAMTPPDLVLRLAALLHDIAKPCTLVVDAGGRRHFYGHEQVGADMADALLKRLRFDNETRHRVVHLVRFHMDLHFDGDVGDAAVRRMIRRIGAEHLHDLIQVRRADRRASGMRNGDLAHETVALLQRVQQVIDQENALRVTDLSVDGRDVIAAFGRPPGPYVGRVLERLLDEVIEDPERNQREYLLERLAHFSTLWYDEE